MDYTTMLAQLELVQECRRKVASAHNLWKAYRKDAEKNGEAAPERPEFAVLLRGLTETAEELDRRKCVVQNALYGVGIIQAEIYSADGRRKCSVVVLRPTERVPEPHIPWTVYNALQSVLGGTPLTTATPFDIVVVDDFGRVSEHRIRTKQGEMK